MNNSTTNTPAPDKQEAEHFLTRLDENAETFLFAAFDDSKDGTLAPIHAHGSLDDIWPRICELNAEGYGIFVTINEVPEGQARKAENITRVRAVFRDWDKPDEQRPPLPLEAITIESSPHKYHEYLPVDEDFPLKLFKPCQNALIQQYGSDKQVNDLPRVMRLPGTINNKPGAEQHVVRLVEDSASIAYTAAQIVDALKPDLQPKAKQERPHSTGQQSDEKWAEICSALKAIKPDCDYKPWLEAGQALHSTGDSRAFDLWDSWSSTAANYPGREVLDSKWAGFTDGKGITIKTLFGHAHSSGWNKPDLEWLKEQAADSAEAEPCNADELKRRVAELAKLPPLEYEQQRDKAAKVLGVRVGALDAAVRKARGETGQDDNGKKLLFAVVTPAAEPVPVIDLLNSIRTVINAHVILPPHADVALSLYSPFTWVFEAFDVCPLILLTSPEKRSGKTRCLDMLARLVYKPLPASNISPASLFRVVEHEQPTLLIDEADQFLTDNPELTGIINSGFTRAAAQVIRCEGDNHEPRTYNTYAPKVIAMIRLPGDTITDRSILVPMVRKTKGETVARLRDRNRFPGLQQQLARFAADHLDELRKAEPTLPAELDDRGQDKWEPLLAIADLAGGDWPEMARTAALALSKTESAEGRGMELLRDCKRIIPKTFNAFNGYVTSEVLLDLLLKLDESSWAEYNRGHPITARGVASLLKPYGIAPKQVGPSEARKRGYLVSTFEAVWDRYLPD